MVTIRDSLNLLPETLVRFQPHPHLLFFLAWLGFYKSGLLQTAMQLELKSR